MTTTLFETVLQFFKEDDWVVFTANYDSLLRVVFQGKNGQFNCLAQTFEEDHQFFFYVICPVNITPECRVTMAEFLLRANYNIRVGSFELDFEDGQLRFKSAIDVEYDRLSTGLVKSMIYSSVLLMDNFLPAILAVAYGSKTPEQAIFDLENATPEAL